MSDADQSEDVGGMRWGLRGRQGLGHLSFCGTLARSVLFFSLVSETRSHEKILNFTTQALICVCKQSLRLLSEEWTENSEGWRQRDQLRPWHLLISKLRL